MVSLDRAAAPSFLPPLLFAALVAATLVALAVTQGARRVGVVLDLVEVPRTFSPDGDGRHDEARIRFRSRRPAEDAAVRIVDLQERVVRSLADGLRLSGDRRVYRFVWNGATSSRDQAPAGRYRVQILIREEDRSIVPGETIRLVRHSGHTTGQATRPRR